MTVQSDVAPPPEPGDPTFMPSDPNVVDENSAGGYEDYFGFEETEKWYFPDGKQYIEYQRMNEGARARFQQKTTKDITVMRQTGDAKMKVDPATERYELMAASVKGWNLMRREGRSGEFMPVPFSIGSPGANFEQWYNSANPKLVDDLEVAIRKANPWLNADMTIEDIEKEEDRLRELKEEIRARERGESSSAAK